jgi:Lrp/AsnC family transcriptional regulator for asnA, asnC and gidA
MKKAGIIIGATLQIDYRRFDYFAIASLVLSVESQQVDRVIELIRKMPNIYTAYRVSAVHNVRVIAKLKNLNELDYVKETIRRLTTVVDLKTYIWTDVINIPENLAICQFQKTTEKTDEVEFPFPETGDTTQKATNKIDALDIQIVEELAKNGRASFKKISETLATSTDTVIKRYQKLKENGIIKVSIQIDPIKIGYRAILNISIASSQNSLSPLINRLAEIPDVVVIIKASGDYDIYAIILIRDIEQLLSIHDEIAKIPGITRTEMDMGRTINIWPTPRQQLSTISQRK